MKKSTFFAEFKKFITRGNVVDMSVGVIVGSAFTAIVNGMTNNILKPVVNWLIAWIFGADSLSDIYTILRPGYKEITDEVTGVVTKEIDLAQSIYIDWGAFVNAVLNFFITAFVLFLIVRIINKMREVGVEHYFVEQDNAADLPDTLNQVVRSVQYLKKEIK